MRRGRIQKGLAFATAIYLLLFSGIWQGRALATCTEHTVSSGDTFSNVTSFAAHMPASVLGNDVCVAVIGGTDFASGTLGLAGLTAPTGTTTWAAPQCSTTDWQQICFDVGVVPGGGDATSTYTWTGLTHGSIVTAQIACASSCNTSTPVDSGTTSSNTCTNHAATSCAVPSATLAGTGDWVIGAATTQASASNNWDTPSPWSALSTGIGATGTWQDYLDQNPGGSSVSLTNTWGGTASAIAEGLIAIQGSAAAPSTPTLDSYLGVNAKSCKGGTASHFYVENSGGRWWFCDPLGHGYYFAGPDIVSYKTNQNGYDVMVPVAACTGNETPWHCCTPGSGQGTCGGKYYNATVNANSQSAVASGVGGNPLCGNASCLVSGAATNPALGWDYNWQLINLERLKSWGFTGLADAALNTELAPEIVDNNWTTSDHTIPLHVPFDFYGLLSSRYALTNSSGCSISSAVKDVLNGINATTYANTQVNSGRLWDTPDYFQPSWTTCLANLLNTTNSPQLHTYATGINNGYLLFAEVDESGQTGWAESGPDFTQIGTDGVMGDAPSYSTHAGWITLVTNPTESTSVGGVVNWGVSYSDEEVYSKVELVNELANEYVCTGGGTSHNGALACCAGAGTGTCSVDPASASYVGSTNMTAGNTIGALNAAWGSSYTTFGTADSACTSNLATCLQGGTYASWGVGTGILDEDGQKGAAWVGSNYNASHLLTGTSAMQADLNHFLYQYAVRYYSTLKSAFNAAAPGILLAMDSGDFGSPARKEVLQAQGQYMDVPEQTFPEFCSNCGSGAQSMAQRIAWSYGYLNKPWVIDFLFATANPDSSIAYNPAIGNNSALTQAARGTFYQNEVAAALDSHVIGFQVYGWSEITVPDKTNWGFTSSWDDPYDGKLATQTLQTDSYGLPSGELQLSNVYCNAANNPWPCCSGDKAGTCGNAGMTREADLACAGVDIAYDNGISGATTSVAPYGTCCTGVGTGTCGANYGDFIDTVTSTNNAIYPTLMGSGVSLPGFSWIL